MPERRSLLAIARALRELPRPEFKTRLKSELEGKAIMASLTETASTVRQTAAPRLRIRNCAAAIEFYQKAFEARELFRFEVHGTVAHAEIAIGNSVINVAEENLPGYPGPETLGGSAVSMHISSDDVDAAIDRAVAAGALLTRPAQDQFYGARSGSVLDPFGYTWNISTRIEEMSLEEMHRRFAEEIGRPPAQYQPPDSQTLVPSLSADPEFVTHVFGGRYEKDRLRVGDTELMVASGEPMPVALHIYVEDTDAVYQRALEAGAESIGEPVDQEYGERSAGVRDRAGNCWYIATALHGPYKPEGLRNVNSYLHPLRAEPVIRFLERAFFAKELEKYASPDGVIHHAKVQLGDTALEMGEAHGPYRPMPTRFYLWVPDVSAAYQRALRAGATASGDAAVKDPFGNEWYLRTYQEG
jgi:PhnB protein